MNMQKILMEAQKMKNKIQKEQERLEQTTYVGSSALVTVTINGKKEIVNVKINGDEIDKNDIEMLEDMIMLAVNDAVKKADEDKANTLNKYGQGLSELM